MDSRKQDGNDWAMLEAWGDQDVMTIARELNLPDELVEVLERLDLRYEVIDGDLVVNASPTFGHEDCCGNLFVQLHAAAPAGMAVLGDFGFFYDALVDGNIKNHTRADITLVRRDQVEQQGTVHPPLLVVEALSPSRKAKDVRIKRDIYERSGVRNYLLLHPVAKTLTILELVDGAYVEKHVAAPPAVVHLDEPFPVDLDLARVFRD